jgi:endophilin-A
LQAKTKEYLQPNPTARAKMIAVKGISKLSGQAKSNTYPQAEGVLADCMLIYGKRLGEDSSLFGEFSHLNPSLTECRLISFFLSDLFSTVKNVTKTFSMFTNNFPSSSSLEPLSCSL